MSTEDEQRTTGAVDIDGTRSGTTRRANQRRGARWARRGLGTLAVTAGILAAIYEYQPQRYDFIARTPPSPNPWTDPDSAHLFRAGANVLIVTAHPDDAEFYLGGLLTRLGATGAKLTLVVGTDGDKGYYPFEDWQRNRRVRQQEQRDAAKIWNAQNVEFLSYPDGRLFANPDVVARIAAIMQRVQPETILCFDYDYSKRLNHRDHRNAGQAAERAAQQAGVGKWLLRFNTLAPNFAVDITREWPRKRELLAIHKSQFYGDKLNMIEGMVGHTAENDGKLLNVRYAEGLRCTRLR